jgi:hypothetical protein
MIRRLGLLVRSIAATLTATATGAATIAMRAAARGNVELKRGDRAPDFTLPGSDSRTYRLSDLVGRGETIVLAWFPKAFTGG